jgi:hypothetical protein
MTSSGTQVHQLRSRAANFSAACLQAIRMSRSMIFAWEVGGSGRIPARGGCGAWLLILHRLRQSRLECVRDLLYRDRLAVGQAGEVYHHIPKTV